MRSRDDKETGSVHLGAKRVSAKGWPFFLRTGRRRQPSPSRLRCPLRATLKVTPHTISAVSPPMSFKRSLESRGESFGGSRRGQVDVGSLNPAAEESTCEGRCVRV